MCNVFEDRVGVIVLLLIQVLALPCSKAIFISPYFTFIMDTASRRWGAPAIHYHPTHWLDRTEMLLKRTIIISFIHPFNSPFLFAVLVYHV